MDVTTLTLTEWDDALPDAGFEAFHRGDALELLDRYAPGDLRLLGGFKGTQPVALLPVFVRDRMFVRSVVSPPSGLAVPRLGPLLMSNSPKQRKREEVNRTFVDAVFEELDLDSRRTRFRMRCSPSYADPRPYTWRGLDVRTAFTYRLTVDDGTDADDLLGAFGRAHRREIRERADLGVTVAEEGVEAAREVHDRTAKRYAERDVEYPLPWAYVRDVVRDLDDHARTYVARDPSGAFLGGVTVLLSNDVAYCWQGGTDAAYGDVSVNTLLHWHVIEGLLDAPSITQYELTGGDAARVCSYRSKFDADLTPYYVVESGGVRTQLLQRAYDVLGA